MSLCAPCAHSSCWRPEEGVRAPGTGVTCGCEPVSVDARDQSWPSEEQFVFFAAKPCFRLSIFL